MAQCAYCGKEIDSAGLKCGACGKAVVREKGIFPELGRGLKEVNSDLEKMFGDMLPAGAKWEASRKEDLKKVLRNEKVKTVLDRIRDLMIAIIKPIDLLFYGQNSKDVQSCPWCNYKFGFLTFSLQFRVAFGFGALRLSDAPQKFFPCLNCGKSIKRETDVEATKLAARKAAWIFIIPVCVWFLMSRIYHISAGTTAVIIVLVALICLELFGIITDYKGQILRKAE